MSPSRTRSMSSGPRTTFAGPKATPGLAAAPSTMHRLWLRRAVVLFFGAWSQPRSSLPGATARCRTCRLRTPTRCPAACRSAFSTCLPIAARSFTCCSLQLGLPLGVVLDVHPDVVVLAELGALALDQLPALRLDLLLFDVEVGLVDHEVVRRHGAGNDRLAEAVDRVDARSSPVVAGFGSSVNMTPERSDCTMYCTTTAMPTFR